MLIKWIVIAGFAIGGLLLSYQGIKQYTTKTSLDAHGLEATAVVTRVEEHESPVRKDQMTTYELMLREHVRFTTQTGETVDAALPLKRPNENVRSVGANVAILYNPERPTEIMEPNGIRFRFIDIFLSLAGAALFIASILISRKF